MPFGLCSHFECYLDWLNITITHRHNIDEMYAIEKRQIWTILCLMSARMVWQMTWIRTKNHVLIPILYNERAITKNYMEQQNNNNKNNSKYHTEKLDWLHNGLEYKIIQKTIITIWHWYETLGFPPFNIRFALETIKNSQNLVCFFYLFSLSLSPERNKVATDLFKFVQFYQFAVAIRCLLL